MTRYVKGSLVLLAFSFAGCGGSARPADQVLAEFGDAEIGSLIAPRALVVEACQAPEAPDPPALINGRNYAAFGKLTTPSPASVSDEFDRLAVHYRRLEVEPRVSLVVSEQGGGPPLGDAALTKFLGAVGAGPLPARTRKFEPPPGSGHAILHRRHW